MADWVDRYARRAAGAEQMMTVRYRLIKGTAFNLIAVAFNQGSTLIANILVARIIMQQSFGEYAMLQTTLLTMAALSQLATGYTAGKYIAEFRTIDPDRAGRIMGVCALTAVVTAAVGTLLLVIMAPWLSGAMLDAPHLSSALVVGAGFLFFTSINGYQMGALAGLEAYVSLAKAGVASGLLTVIAISLGAWSGGVNGALLGLSISALFRFAIHHLFIRSESRLSGITPKYRGSLRKEKAIMFRFALPAAITGYYTLPMIWLAHTFLVHQPNGYREMALYSAANNLRILALFLPGVINSVGLSVLNNEKAKRDLGHYQRVFRSNVLHILLVSVTGAMVIGVFGKNILDLFGKEFAVAYAILWFLLVSSIFEAMSIALYQYVQSQAKIWYSFFGINIPRETFLVISAYYLVQWYGGAGLAIAVMGSTILGLVCHLSLVALLHKNAQRPIAAPTG